jgi:hypothetical protein
MAVVRKNIKLKIQNSKLKEDGLGADNFPPEGEDAGVGFGGFGVGDVAEADVDLGEGGPGEEVVGLEGGGLEGGTEGFLEVACFQERHGEGVPGIEVRGIQRDALAVESGGLVELAKGEVAAGFVVDFLDRFAQNSEPGMKEAGRNPRPLFVVKRLDAGGFRLGSQP